MRPRSHPRRDHCEARTAGSRAAPSGWTARPAQPAAAGQPASRHRLPRVRETARADHAIRSHHQRSIVHLLFTYAALSRGATRLSRGAGDFDWHRAVRAGAENEGQRAVGACIGCQGADIVRIHEFWPRLGRDYGTGRCAHSPSIAPRRRKKVATCRGGAAAGCARSTTLPLWTLGAIRLGQELLKVNVMVFFLVVLTLIPVTISARLAGGSFTSRTEIR